MIFGVFERVLSTLDAEGQRLLGPAWEGEVSNSLQKLREYYGGRNLLNPHRVLVDYSGLATQAAYIFMYAIGRAEFTFQILRRFRTMSDAPLFSEGVLNISSLGGGPASELVGLIKYLEDPAHGESVSEIFYDVLDKEGDWDELAQLVIESLDSEIVVRPRFISVDITDSQRVGQLSLELDHLVMMSFFISEICELPQAKTVKDNMEKLLSTMRAGGKLFYNDSNAYSFYAYMNGRARSIKGLTEVHEVQEQIVFDYGDPGDTYLTYMAKFDVIPHLTSNALAKFYRRQ